ncbi:MAG: hypothetical protein MZV64_16750 [Ignavibacteriales bacterium]|nr:hypothetical protein [Ignavibacteriales bacterium]
MGDGGAVPEGRRVRRHLLMNGNRHHGYRAADHGGTGGDRDRAGRKGTVRTPARSRRR